MVRIITHGGCADGFFSAYIFKKHILPVIAPAKDKEHVEIIGVGPKDVQTDQFEFQKDDIVLDLPCPNVNVLFWCDHHETSNPRDVPNFYWKKAPSCTGYLIDLFDKFNIAKTPEILEFKTEVDKIDDADFTLDEINSSFFTPDFVNPSNLQKITAISSLIRTRDYELNGEIVKEIFSHPLAQTPFSDKNLWALNPILYYKARIANYKTWRGWLDTFVYYDADLRTVIQDNRLAQTYEIGLFDRFYVFVKYPDSLFGLNIEYNGKDNARIGISTNIFKKSEINVNVGRLCNRIAKEFGTGAGGGHILVGSTTIRKESLNQALEIIKKELSENKA